MRAISFFVDPCSYIVPACRGLTHWVSKTNLWINGGKPFYQKHVEPLQKRDYAVMATSVGLAATVTAVAYHALGVGVIPLMVGLDIALVLGGYAIGKFRANRRADQKAKQHVQNIVATAKGITLTKQKFHAIKKEISLLKKNPCFEHREKDWEQLDKQTDTFKNDILKPNASFADTKKVFLKFLDELEKKL